MQHIMCKYQHHNKRVLGKKWEVDRQKFELSKCATVRYHTILFSKH